MKKLHNNTVRQPTRIISFCLSEEDSPEKQENQNINFSQLVNATDEPPHKPSIHTRHSKSTAPLFQGKDLPMIELEDCCENVLNQTKDRLPKRQQPKGILTLNRQCSSERRSLLDEKFKLIGADLKKTLKDKIDGELELFKNLTLGKC